LGPGRWPWSLGQNEATGIQALVCPLNRPGRGPPPEHYICRCGAALAQVCQVPEGFGFDKRPWPIAQN
jgi:hypothetical protein